LASQSEASLGKNARHYLKNKVKITKVKRFGDVAQEAECKLEFKFQYCQKIFKN
jgi:hypothetical protein